MDIRDRRGLKAAAEQALDRAPNHKKILLIWAGVNTVLPLLASVISLILNSQISNTGGLSGIGLRSVLSTAQSVLSLSISLLLPFWTLGYTAAVLRFARKQPAEPATLLAGFRRFGSVLGVTLLKALICAAVCIACFYASILFLSITPLANPIYSILKSSEQFLQSGVLDESTLQSTAEAMMPMFAVCAVICCVVVIPVLYRLRLAELRVMDSPRCGAIYAIQESRYLMRRNCTKLFLLDLSFWWFYLLQILLSLLCYGDVLLPMLGVTFPFSDDVAYFVFYIAGLLGQLLLLYCVGNKVQTTYALFYDALRTPPKEDTSLSI